jgi:tetratricopeptide (TPR) repeat protein
MKRGNVRRCADSMIADRISKFSLIMALLIAAVHVSGCGKGGGPIAGKEPVKDVVKVEDNIGALRAWTEHKAKAAVLVHIDPADDMAIFSSVLAEDMKNAAVYLKRRNMEIFNVLGPLVDKGGIVNLGAMSGMYQRVIWVVPSRRPVAETPPKIYRDFFIQQRKFPEAEVGEFKTEGNHIIGSIAGIPVTITRLSDITIGANENAIIDIDLAYFPYKRREDSSYMVGTRTLLSFLRELGDRNIRTRLVTVTYSIQAGLVPMDLRFFGSVIQEGLATPSMLSGQVPEKWQMMIQAEDSMRAGRYASAEALYSMILDKGAADAGIYFALAVARGFQDKGTEARGALLDAHAIDAEYLRGFTQLARVLGAAGKVTAGSEILDTPELTKILAPVELEYQKGVFYSTAGRPFDAITHLQNVAPQRPKDFGLFSIMYKVYRDIGDTEGQRASLQKLIAIDDRRVAREMSWVYADLGNLYEAADSTENALHMYEKYVKANPDDSLSAVLGKKIKAWSAKTSGAPKR